MRTRTEKLSQVRVLTETRDALRTEADKLGLKQWALMEVVVNSYFRGDK